MFIVLAHIFTFSVLCLFMLKDLLFLFLTVPILSQNRFQPVF